MVDSAVAQMTVPIRLNTPNGTAGTSIRPETSPAKARSSAQPGDRDRPGAPPAKNRSPVQVFLGDQHVLAEPLDGAAAALAAMGI